jgi:hypothetical protein
MLSVIPNQNLISNIGFGPDATHTRTVDEHSNLDTSPMTFPLVHPRVMVADEAADRLWARSSYDERFRGRVRRHLKEALLPILGALRGA